MPRKSSFIDATVARGGYAGLHHDGITDIVVIIT